MHIFHRFHGNYALVRFIGASQSSAMELFILPMSCSFAAHVACLEAGVTPVLRRVARESKLLDDGTAYAQLAPKTNVPAIRTDDGCVLTESSAVLQYIADLAPERQLAPPAGSRERYRLAEWLNFVATEVHKKHIWAIFSSKTSPEHKEWARVNAAPMLGFVERHLTGREFLLGERFTVADAYLWWALFIAPFGKLSLDAYPSLRAYVDRIRARPSVVAALAHDVPLFQAESAGNAATVAAAGRPASRGAEVERV
jgi:glutathione S-transferase